MVLNSKCFLPKHTVHSVLLVPFTLKDFDLCISQIATDNVSYSTPMVVDFKVAAMLSHDLLDLLQRKLCVHHYAVSGVLRCKI